MITPAVALLSFYSLVIGIAACCCAVLFRKLSSWRTIDRVWTLLWLLATLFVILTSRLMLIHRFGTDVPYWDQWGAEGAFLLRPFLDGHLEWTQMLSAHNEHRILFTRIAALGLFLVNHRWDALVECVFNVLLLIPLVGILFMRFTHCLGARLAPLVSIVLLAIFAPPMAWENTLAGFQSQFYFMAIATLASFHFVSLDQTSPRSSFVAAACAVSALVCMGSGLAAAGSMLAIEVAEVLFFERAWSSSRALRIAAWAAIVALGAALSVRVEGHAALHAHSATEFLSALARSLAYPWIDRPLLAVVQWIPFCILAVGCLRRSFGGPEIRFLMLLGCWVLIQSAAIAWARGARDIPIASRYFDTLGLGVAVNVIGIAVLARKLAGFELLFRILAAVWMLVSCIGLAHLTFKQLPGALGRGAVYSRQRENVASYLVSGDFGVLQRAPYHEIPYPDPSFLRLQLDSPSLRRVFPPSLSAVINSHDESMATNVESAIGIGRLRQIVNPLLDNSDRLATISLALITFLGLLGVSWFEARFENRTGVGEGVGRKSSA